MEKLGVPAASWVRKLAKAETGNEKILQSKPRTRNGTNWANALDKNLEIEIELGKW